LILKGPSGYGKKHLLFNWIDYHQTNSRKVSLFKYRRNTKISLSLILPNRLMDNRLATSMPFIISSIKSEYVVSLYLKEQLDMSQKIEILEEKLRKYFSYFLDNAINKIK